MHIARLARVREYEQQVMSKTQGVGAFLVVIQAEFFRMTVPLEVAVLKALDIAPDETSCLEDAEQATVMYLRAIRQIARLETDSQSTAGGSAKQPRPGRTPRAR